MRSWRASSRTDAETLLRLPPMVWRRGRMRRGEALWLLVPWCSALVLMPTQAWLWLGGCALALALNARRGGSVHRVLQFAATPRVPSRVYVDIGDGNGFELLRIAWLDERRLVLRGPPRVIYRDELSARDFARLRRWSLGVYPCLQPLG
ncbi:MAG: hypothetical protein AAF515_17145 [Pseudomonadota bacterium]